MQALRVLFVGEMKITLFGEQLLENLQRKQREDFFHKARSFHELVYSTSPQDYISNETGRAIWQGPGAGGSLSTSE